MPSRLASLSALSCLLFCAAAIAEESAPRGITIEGAWTGEVFGNARGGVERGARHLSNADLTLALDGAAFGAEGFKLFAYGLYDDGGAISGDLVGDAQGVSNIEADPAARLYELWAEQAFSFGSLRFGLYDLNSEFDAIETAGLFLGASHGIGPDFSQSGLNGPSIFPVTSLAGRLALHVGPAVLRFAALDGVPGDPSHPKRTTIRFERGDGALLVGEVDYSVGERARAALGLWRSTGRFERVRDAVLATPGELHTGNLGAYAFVESALWSEGDGEGLAGFLRAGFADGDVNAFSHYLGAGFVYTGALPRRPEDQLGLAVAHARFGDEFRDAQAQLGRAWGRAETALELTYRIALTDWFALQPDLQYVASPSGDPNLRDALAIGIRFELRAGRSW